MASGSVRSKCSTRRDGAFTADDQRGLIELASYAAVALENTQQFAELLERHEKLVEQAAQDTLLVGESPAIQAVRSTARRIADTDLAMLILGENGTGKEVVARAIHFGSRRRKHPFIAVNCAALTETLLESELFGHEKGAFTDAHEARAGKFELASGGTLFLDEIGDMSLAGQAKLLRVLEDKTIVRVGGSRPIHTDVRVLAATNQKLAELVRARRFREDLYFRLNVVSLELPPLRERGDDVDAARRAFPAAVLQASRPPRAEVHRRRPQTAGKPHLARQRPRAAKSHGAARLSVDRRSHRGRGPGVHPLACCRRASSIIGAGRELNDATHEFQRKYIQQAIDARPRQRQPGRQKPRRAPLESVSQDAAAGHGNRRGDNLDSHADREQRCYSHPNTLLHESPQQRIRFRRLANRVNEVVVRHARNSFDVFRVRDDSLQHRRRSSSGWNCVQ